MLDYVSHYGVRTKVQSMGILLKDGEIFVSRKSQFLFLYRYSQCVLNIFLKLSKDLPISMEVILYYYIHVKLKTLIYITVERFESS